MDGDHTAKSFEQGANSALKENEMSTGIHESVKQIPSAGDKTTGTGTSMFSKDGALGSMFNADGAIGGTAQKVGGPLDKEGSIGQHFNADGKIGGMVQENLANKK
ncbi:hypothetical protein HO173_010077 [Letharia columbiana]|uniref:Uncharacterized protein n=1 Tax=Letharia columbiana TaxID=112416 RepID=A0A8H6FNG8_9LECA|nr:uncharacterized protein HO173_010077 [Letharia columbiana]KAF6231775.1 hypothetical protein HO173_010077 [Letharia columbiana]